jgi:nicotinamide-nucleotide amidase
MTLPDGAPIRDAILESFSRADILLVTGGLGPTTDDVTREIVAELLGQKLIFNSETLNRIQERCKRRGFDFQPRMERQAMTPESATVLPNDNGTAPGLYLPPVEGISWSSPHIFLLPGPPRELQPMALAHVLPFLKNLAQHHSCGVLQECRVY